MAFYISLTSLHHLRLGVVEILDYKKTLAMAIFSVALSHSRTRKTLPLPLSLSPCILYFSCSRARRETETETRSAIKNKARRLYTFYY